MAPPRHALLVAAAFAAVYLIWGSTYLGIRVAIETMPPFTMAGARWLIAGAILYAWRRAAGDEPPTRRHWLTATIVGAALIVGGNGTVSWAELVVPSGLTALLIAIVPVWIAVLVWAREKQRPAPRVLAGIAVGLLGVAVLVAPTLVDGFGAGGALALGCLLILGASLSWAAGSLYSRRAPTPKSSLMGAAMQMLAGGALLMALGGATGEFARVDLARVSVASWIAFGFLAIFGSIVAYSAYVWLLREVRPEMVATYAFVNPIVAVLLGVLVAHEAFGPTTLVATALIVVGVALVVTASRKPVAPPATPPPSDS